MYIGQEEEEQSDDDDSLDTAPGEEDSDELEAYDLEDDDNGRGSAKVPVYLRDVLSGTLDKSNETMNLSYHFLAQVFVLKTT